MRHLAGAGDIPAILVMQGVADCCTPSPRADRCGSPSPDNRDSDALRQAQAAHGPFWDRRRRFGAMTGAAFIGLILPARCPLDRAWIKGVVKDPRPGNSWSNRIGNRHSKVPSVHMANYRILPKDEATCIGSGITITFVRRNRSEIKRMIRKPMPIRFSPS